MAHLLSQDYVTEDGIVGPLGRSWVLVLESPGFEFQLYYLLTLLGWASYWLLWTYFLICKQGWLLPTPDGLQNK